MAGRVQPLVVNLDWSGTGVFLLLLSTAKLPQPHFHMASQVIAVPFLTYTRACVQPDSPPAALS
eukprot:1153832-Pelagomonas_calceolata.AAC.2